MPPASETTFSYPSSSSVRAANVERLPEAQYATIGRARAGTACSIRDSSQPRGRWTAPGIWPSSHSSRSRTSTKTAGSASSCSSRARSASISSICCRVSWRKSRYELIAFQFIATGLRLWSKREPADAYVFARRTCRRGRRRARCRHGGFHANQHAERDGSDTDDSEPVRPRTRACPRPGRPNRPRGGRAPTCQPALLVRQACRGRTHLHSLPVAASAGRRRVGGVAVRDGDAASGARRQPPHERTRAAPPRPGRGLLRTDPGRSSRLAAGVGTRSERAGRRLRRDPALPGLRPRAAAVRAELCGAGLDRAPLVAAAARRLGARLPRRWLSGEAALRLGAATARATGLRRAPVRRGRAARSERRRGAGRRRSRALLEGEAGPRVLQARPSGAAFSALPERPVPPRRAPPLDRTTEEGRPGAEARVRRRENHPARQNVARVSGATPSEVGPCHAPNP